MFYTIQLTRIVLVLLVICSGTFNLQAQRASTSNTGVLYVSPETVMSVEGNFTNIEEGDYRNDGEVFLKGNFENQGITDFIQEGGITRFEGYSIQDITGNQPAYFYNVLFNNDQDPVPFLLSGTMSVEGGVSFYQGIVDNENYLGVFEMNEEAYHFNTNDESHVNGPVNRLGNDEFTFPVGKKGYYRPAVIASITDPQVYFDGEFFFENSDKPETPHRLTSDKITRIDNQQFWTIEETISGNPDQMLLSLTYRDATTPHFIMDAVENETVTIVRWDEDSNMWVDQGGIVDFENEMVTTTVDGFGIFTFATLNDEQLTACKVMVYNAVTPNGDGINDYFRIDKDDCAGNLRVQIFNRWGRKIWESDNYGHNGEVFDGYSKGHLTVREGKSQVPTGTYFYILEYDYDSGDGKATQQKAGYLYISGN